MNTVVNDPTRRQARTGPDPERDRLYLDVVAKFFHLMREYERLHAEHVAALQELIRLREGAGR